VLPDPEFLVCCDVNRYLINYASKMKAGLIPYRNFDCEYPPIGLLLFSLPVIVTSDIIVFQYLFVLEQLIFELIGLVIIGTLLRRIRATKEEMFFVIFGYIFLLTSVGSTLYSRFDMAVSVQVLSAIYLFLIDKKKSAWILLAVSFMTKPYTIVVAPLFLIAQLREKKSRNREVLKNLLVFSCTLLVIALPFLYWSYQGFIHSFFYHAERGIQIETLYSSFVHVLHALGIGPDITVKFQYGAFELISPITPFLSTLAFILTIIALLGAYLAFFKMKIWHEDPDLKTRVFYLYQGGVVSILIFIIFYKVFSSQFLIWTYPLIPLIFIKPELKEKTVLGLFGIIGAATQLIYPYNYVLTNGIWLNVVFVLLIRNLLLLFCLVVIGTWNQIENWTSRFILLIVAILGVLIIEIYPTRYLAKGFPSLYTLLGFLFAMGLFHYWDALKIRVEKILTP